MTQIGHVEQVGFLSYNKVGYELVKSLVPLLPNTRRLRSLTLIHVLKENNLALIPRVSQTLHVY